MRTIEEQINISIFISYLEFDDISETTSKYNKIEREREREKNIFIYKISSEHKSDRKNDELG
jgi:hypothetical protein